MSRSGDKRFKRSVDRGKDSSSDEDDDDVVGHPQTAPKLAAADEQGVDEYAKRYQESRDTVIYVTFGIIFCIMAVVACVSIAGMPQCRGGDPEECITFVWKWLRESPLWHMAVVLGVITCFIYLTHTGKTHIFRDWAPGTALLLTIGLIVIRLHGDNWRRTVAYTLSGVLIYAVVGVVYSFGGLWWEIRRRGVLTELIKDTSKLPDGGATAENIVNALEGDIFRMMMYWPFAVFRQLILALARDFFTMCYDRMRHLYVSIVAKALSAIRAT